MPSYKDKPGLAQRTRDNDGVQIQSLKPNRWCKLGMCNTNINLILVALQEIVQPARLDEAITPGMTPTEEEIKYLEEPYEPRRLVGHA